MNKREREGEQRGRSLGIIRQPTYRRTAADDIEDGMEADHEYHLDWVLEAKRLSCLGVPFRLWPLEISKAVAWIFQNEDTLVLYGIRKRM